MLLFSFFFLSWFVFIILNQLHRQNCFIHLGNCLDLLSSLYFWIGLFDEVLLVHSSFDDLVVADELVGLGCNCCNLFFSRDNFFCSSTCSDFFSATSTSLQILINLLLSLPCYRCFLFTYF